MANETTFKNPLVIKAFEDFMVEPERRDDIAKHYAATLGELENLYPAFIGPIKRQAAG